MNIETIHRIMRSPEVSAWATKRVFDLMPPAPTGRDHQDQADSWRDLASRLRMAADQLDSLGND